jgi:hypothetical protein
MIYLASPYSHPDPLIMKTRFLLAEQCCAGLLRNRQWVYSPIVHCHELSQKFSLPTDFTYWRDYNFNLLRHATAVFVLDIKGWNESKGVMAELDMARQLDISHWFVNPEGDRWLAVPEER